jgi:hypothetical protein
VAGTRVSNAGLSPLAARGALELRVITLNEGETIDVGDVTIAEGAR